MTGTAVAGELSLDTVRRLFFALAGMTAEMMRLEHQRQAYPRMNGLDMSRSGEFMASADRALRGCRSAKTGEHPTECQIQELYAETMKLAEELTRLENARLADPRLSDFAVDMEKVTYAEAAMAGIRQPDACLAMAAAT